MRTMTVAVALLVSLLLVGPACTLLGPSRAELPQLHGLAWSAPTSAPHAPTDAPALLVGIPRAGPGFDSPRMAYTAEPHALAYFARHQWVDTPARMLQPLLVRAAESTGRFAAVVQGPTSVATDLRLDTEIVELVQDFSVRPSRVRLALRAQLVDVAERRVVAVRDVTLSEPAPNDDPAGGVEAANRVLGAALRAVAELCAVAAPR